MNQSELTSIYGTLSRLENYLYQHSPDDEESEMLLCEIDESMLYIREELTARLAVEMAEVAGHEEPADFFDLAEQEVSNIFG